jgi:hypothetical protein
MHRTLTGFRKFIEEMDPNPEKSREIAMGTGEKPSGGKEDYFSALGDEQGIEWKTLATIFEDEPWVSAHFGLGKPNQEVMYKLAAWEIVPGSMNPQGADIRLKPQKGNRSYLQGNRLNKSKQADTQRYHLNREELIKFLTTGWTPAVQAAAGGAGDAAGMSGLPPMM